MFYEQCSDIFLLYTRLRKHIIYFYRYISIPEYLRELYFSELLVQNRKNSVFSHEQVITFSVPFCMSRTYVYDMHISPFNVSFVFFMDREELNKDTWGVVLSNSL